MVSSNSINNNWIFATSFCNFSTNMRMRTFNFSSNCFTNIMQKPARNAIAPSRPSSSAIIRANKPTSLLCLNILRKTGSKMQFTKKRNNFRINPLKIKFQDHFLTILFNHLFNFFFTLSNGFFNTCWINTAINN